MPRKSQQERRREERGRGGQVEEEEEEGGGEAICGNAECGGFGVSNGAQAICIPPATGLVGCCRWI